MIKARRVESGDRLAAVAPASPFERDAFERGVGEFGRLGLTVIHDERLFARTGFVAGAPALRASAIRDAWSADDVAGLVAARGGYGSVQVLGLLDRREALTARKPFVGSSDVTSLLTFLTTGCGLVAFHGPMVASTMGRGEAAYDPASLMASLTRPEPLGELASPTLECLRDGEASGILLGGTLTQLAASLGTPFAFDPPQGHILFLDEVGERPYRIDRMLTQLRLAGILRRASAVVFGELPQCDEPGGRPTARSVVADVLADFPGPILFGLPSGHATQPCLTLPLGVAARVVARERPRLIIEEAAVE